MLFVETSRNVKEKTKLANFQKKTKIYFSILMNNSKLKFKKQYNL